MWRELDGTECCPSSQADVITNVVWGTGKVTLLTLFRWLLTLPQLENCSMSMKLSVSGGSGSGFAADIAEITSLGSISRVTITNNGRGYTSDPSLVASDAKCRCTPKTYTCSSGNFGSALTPGTHGTTFTSADACVSSCTNVDGSHGLCCPPGSQASLDGDIPVCNPPVSLPGNVAGNLDSCIRPVRTGCGGLSVCSATATSQQENVIRRLYPELVEQHRKWPHGFNYLQVHAGYEGEALGNLFLKDYTQVLACLPPSFPIRLSPASSLSPPAPALPLLHPPDDRPVLSALLLRRLHQDPRRDLQARDGGQEARVQHLHPPRQRTTRDRLHHHRLPGDNVLTSSLPSSRSSGPRPLRRSTRLQGLR